MLNLTEALRRGNTVIIVATILTTMALTWAGVQYPWNSAHVLAPLVIGLVMIVAFFFYEAWFPIEPVVPWDLVSNRTSFIG